MAAGTAVTLPPDAVDVPSGLPADAIDVAHPDGTGFSGMLKEYAHKMGAFGEGITAAVKNPVGSAVSSAIDTVQQSKEMAQHAEEAFKRGDFVEGARHSLHYMLSLIPGVGSGLEEAANKAQAGDYAGAIGDTAALATQLAGPKVAEGLSAIPGKVAGATGAAVDTVRSAASNLSPETLRTAGDVAGLVSPRAAHALNLLNKIRGAVSRTTTSPATPTAAASPAPGPRIVPGEAPPPARSDFRQGIVDELNQPAAASVSEPAAETPPPAQPAATPALQSAAPQPTPVAAAPAPTAEAAAPTSPANSFEGAARTKRATALARFLYSNGEGITHADALRMSPDHWKLAWKGAEQLGGEGIDFTRQPSLKTQREALKQLKSWEDATGEAVAK